MIKIYTLKDRVKFSSEQIILFGLLKNYDIFDREEGHNFNFKNESRYKNVIETCKQLFVYTDNIKDCDIIVFPYKFNGIQDKTFKILYSLSIKLNKKLYVFFNDDYDKPIIPYNKNIVIYRTSFYKSNRLLNEFSLPAFSPDYF